MILHIDPGSAVPPYEQIRQQVVALTESGQLAAGVRLPPIRQLAADLGLATGTVARAYRELESEGVVASRVRHGTTVVSQPTPTPRQAERRLAAAAKAYALAALTLGVDRDRAVTALDTALADWRP